MKRISFLFIALSLLLIQPQQSYAQFGKNKKKSGMEKNTRNEKTQQKLQFAFGEALRLKSIYNFNDAATYFQECIKLDPDMAAAYFELSNIYHRLNDLDKALENAKKAADLEKDNYWYQKLYIETLHKMERYSEALRFGEDLLSRFPEKEELTMMVSTLYFINRKYEKGINLLDEQERKYGLREDLLQRKKVAYIQMNKMDKAAGEVKKLIELNPQDIDNYLDLADLMNAMGKKEEAIKTLQELATNFPSDGGVHLSLAELYRKNGENDKAFEELKIAFSDSTVNIDLKMRILLSYFGVINDNPEFKEEADQLLQSLLESHPKEAKAHTIYGDFLYNEKKLRAAKYHFEKATEIDNSRFAIWNQLIVIEVELENYDSVIVVSDRAKDYFPNQPTLYYFSGIANLQLEKYEAAVQQLEYGQRMVLDNEQLLLQFLLNLGDAYNELNQFEKSDEAFEEALTLDPNNANVMNNYAYYLSLRNENLERAAEMSAKSNLLSENQGSYEDTYAWILFKQKKYKDAAKWIQKALEHGGDLSSEVLEHAGDIYFMLDEVDKALEYWKKARLLGEGSEMLEKKIQDKKLYE